MGKSISTLHAVVIFYYEGTFNFQTLPDISDVVKLKYSESAYRYYRNNQFKSKD